MSLNGAFISSSSFCLFYLAKGSVKIYCFKEIHVRWVNFYSQSLFAKYVQTKYLYKDWDDWKIKSKIWNDGLIFTHNHFLRSTYKQKISTKTETIERSNLKSEMMGKFLLTITFCEVRTNKISLQRTRRPLSALTERRVSTFLSRRRGGSVHFLLNYYTVLLHGESRPDILFGQLVH